MSCWKCVVNAILVSPPLLAYVLYHRYRNNQGFRDALNSLRVRLEKLKDLEEGALAYEDEKTRAASEAVHRP